jgi:hypothetical protein
MQVEPELIFREKSKEAELRPWCENVLGHFQLPQQALIAIFDDSERPEFRSSPFLGENYCGFFHSIRQSRWGPVPWPLDLKEHVRDDRARDSQYWRCDVVIYLRSRTCQSAIGTVITFAHELQHYIQHGFRNKAWRDSQEFRHFLEFSGQGAFPWEFPHEREAQVVSRKIAEDLCGKDEVRRYGEQQIELNRDAKKWEVFLGF